MNLDETIKEVETHPLSKCGNNNEPLRNCIYVGKSLTLRKRLSNHIKRKRRKSTLRRSLGAIIGNTKDIEKEINDFIDELEVSYFYVERKRLSQKEKETINNGYLRVLNIDENNHPKAPIEKIKKLRKEIVTPISRKVLLDRQTG